MLFFHLATEGVPLLPRTSLSLGVAVVVPADPILKTGADALVEAKATDGRVAVVAELISWGSATRTFFLADSWNLLSRLSDVPVGVWLSSWLESVACLMALLLMPSRDERGLGWAVTFISAGAVAGPVSSTRFRFVFQGVRNDKNPPSLLPASSWSSSLLIRWREAEREDSVAGDLEGRWRPSSGV